MRLDQLNILAPIAAAVSSLAIGALSRSRLLAQRTLMPLLVHVAVHDIAFRLMARIPDPRHRMIR